MKINIRLALYFTLLSSALLLVIMVGMYLSFGYFFRTDFYERLHDRAKVASQLYLEADEISADSLNRVRTRMLEQLPDEKIRVYDDHNRASFIKDDSRYWDTQTIEKVRREQLLGFSEGNRQTIGINYPDNQGTFVILVSAVDTQGRARLMQILQVMAITFTLVTGLLFFIGRWFAREALAPIDKLAKQMRRISASQLSFRADEGNGKDEISSLAQSFNRLLEHLQNSFELQQTFVANASHELRTPLTVITGEIEVALQQHRSVESYELLLRSILADAGRLGETVTSLMELARTDMEYTRAETEPVQIDELIWELHDHWAPKPLKIDLAQLPEEQEHLQIHANKKLLKIALNNVIANGFKFSSGQPITCRLEADERQINILIKDNGIGIAEADQAKLFIPFFRGSNRGNFEGSGVGLYITSKIIQLFNGKITINSVVGEGTTIQISFSTIF